MFCVFSFSQMAFGQGTVKVFSKLNYYTDETQGQVIGVIPDDQPIDHAWIQLFRDGRTIGESDSTADHLIKIAFNLSNFPLGESPVNYKLYNAGKLAGEGSVKITKLAPEDNAVKIDLETGGLIVDNLPFFPFGFYCGSPVGDLPDQEVVQGFNMIGPYQRNLPDGLEERKAYMDRCAAIGIKVNYGVNSLIGSGHNGSKTYDLSQDELLDLLKKEVITFRDHPALLSWYLNDEPLGQGRPVDLMVKAYGLIKSLDPYHPVSIVFMMPHRADEFRDAMDIAMTDPYPIPGPVDKVQTDVEQLDRHFRYEKSIWLVPQAFGGGEFWTREPTPQEIRAMTYIGLMRHVTGIQYFMRTPPNLRPKSTISWNECGKMALEVAQMKPFLLSGELAPEVECDDDRVLVKSWKYKGKTLVIAVNKDNAPKDFNIAFRKEYSDQKVDVWFENRQEDLHNGMISDFIDGYGTRVYLMDQSKADSTTAIHPTNLMINPSFEKVYNASMPSGCYARYHKRGQGDHASTYFVDSRQRVDGLYSLRLNTPQDSDGVQLDFFPIVLNPGNSYSVSVWAKAAKSDIMPVYRLSIDQLNVEKTFELTSDWKKYSFSFHVDSVGASASVSLELVTKGTAWFDLLQVDPDPTIAYDINPDQTATVSLGTIAENAQLRYELGEKEPTINSKKFQNPFRLKKASMIHAGLFLDKKLIAETSQLIPVNKALGKPVTFQTKYSPKYKANGDGSLTDGILGSTAFKDGKWLGFEGIDMDVTVDLGKVSAFDRVTINFLCDVNSGIHLPKGIHLLVSDDGENFKPAGSVINDEGSKHGGAYIKPFAIVSKQSKARYIKIEVKNIGEIPQGYLFPKTRAWIFADEIMVE